MSLKVGDTVTTENGQTLVFDGTALVVVTSIGSGDGPAATVATPSKPETVKVRQYGHTTHVDRPDPARPAFKRQYAIIGTGGKVKPSPVNGDAAADRVGTATDPAGDPNTVVYAWTNPKPGTSPIRKVLWYVDADGAGSGINFTATVVGETVAIRDAWSVGVAKDPKRATVKPVTA